MALFELWNLPLSSFLLPYKEISASCSFPRNLCITEVLHKIIIDEPTNEQLNIFETYMQAVKKASSYVRGRRKWVLFFPILREK